MSNYDGLSLEERQWIGSAIAGMILADGSLDASEIQAFRKNTTFLDETSLQKLIEQLRNKTLEELPDIKLDKQTAFTLLKQLSQLAVVDKSFSENEESYLREISSKLGFPEEVGNRLVEATKKVIADLFRAKLSFRKHRIPVMCMDVTRKGCMVSSKMNLPEGTQVILEFLHSEEEQEYFTAFPAKARVTKPSDQSPGSYISQVEFGVKINLNHGILHRLNPKNYQEGTPEQLKSPSELMQGQYVVCRTCGEEQVKFWQPASRDQLEYNIFGFPNLPRSTDVKGGFNFVNYEPAVCPHCFFASPDPKMFYVPGDPVQPVRSSSSEFLNKWLITINNRKSLQENTGVTWLDVHERGLDEGLGAWKFVAETYTLLTELGGKRAQSQSLFLVYGMAQQAQLQLLKGFPSMAQGLIQRCIRELTVLEESLTGSVRTHALALIGMMSIYDDDKFHTRDAVNRLKEHRKTLEGDEEALVGEYLEAFEGLGKAVASYAKAKRKDFDATEEIPGLSKFGSRMNLLESA